MRLVHGPGWNAANRVICRADGTPVKPDVLSNSWAGWVRRHGLEPAVTLHGLRHSYATSLYNLGVRTKTVQDRLGHSSPAITRAIYVHGTDAADLDAIRMQSADIARARQELKNSRPISGQPVPIEVAKSKKSCT